VFGLWSGGRWEGSPPRSAGGLPLGGFSGGWLRVGSWFTDGALGVPEVGSRGGICSVGDGTFFVHAANRISASTVRVVQFKVAGCKVRANKR